MCGRYAITTAPEAMRRIFKYQEMPDFPARYNVAPSQPIPVVRLWDGERQFALMRWGLIPGFVKDPKTISLLFNARGETVNERPAFKNAMKRRRCLIPANGFYEWRRDGASNQPYFIQRRDGGLLAFAGLWETWIGPNGEELDTAAIVTTDASPSIRSIHHRMPVILPPETWDMWLDSRRVDAQMAAALIAAAPDDALEVYEVSPAVNRAVHDGPELIARYTPPPVTETAAAPAKAARKSKKDDRQQSLF
ncbi:SOS response-associated peptidase [Pseudorhodoplanes sp.]|uniref:SOS response-associated peptidase n=1 Tax=Pseudorhodoplanes sp. TaxID=1934341 RepID=UPI002C56D7A4|nr:SOS response-associated peptidase [Pseudorhodoplanes sp.]HWV42095.1 SOS response-associated peptidase [Pseudorhodoplanes sp.]